MNNLYYAPRGDAFKSFLTQILKLAPLKEQYLQNVLLDDYALSIYHCAFTHSTVDVKHNYEYLEFLGDITLNKAIAWYLANKFPQLRCPDGVKILTRLKINLISKKSFAMFAKKLSFWEFVSCDMETRNNKMDKTLEDVFEAFFGATELLLNERIKVGVGYAVCYDIAEKLLNQYANLSLRYEDLFDAKTRLKEIVDFFGEELGKIEYVAVRTMDSGSPKGISKDSRGERNTSYHTVDIIQDLNGMKTILGTGVSALKSDASQKAAEIAIQTLHRKGIFKPLPDCYKKFCE